MAEVVKIDPSVFADRLRDRIRATLGDLIPEDAWDTLMKAEMDRFFNARREGSGFYERSIPSDFTAIVQEMFAQHVRERVKNFLANDPSWQRRWDGAGDAIIPTALEAMIERNLPVLMRECVGAFFSGFAACAATSAVMQIEQRMRSG